MRSGRGGITVSSCTRVTVGCKDRAWTGVGAAVGAGAAGAPALASAVWKKARWAAARASPAAGDVAGGWAGRPEIGVRAKGIQVRNAQREAAKA
jgi:hypothetical protein